MEPVWDAVVVGAGPAGCAAAYDLAAAGRRVLLVDRAAFPRPKACAGGLTTKAVRALRYPIDPVVRRWVRSIDLEQNAGNTVRVGRRVPVCAMTVREELDQFCLEQTRARGAAFERVGRLEALEQGSDRVLLRFAEQEGIAARFVVGADGVHSRVRTLLGPAPWFRTGFALEANVPYMQPDEGYPLTFDFAPVSRGYGWLFPRDTHVNVGLYVSSAGEKLDRVALDAYIAARCGPGRERSVPVGQFLGLGAAHYQPPAAARVLLAGDAAGFVDPLTGEGIHGAIRSGQGAAAAILAACGQADHHSRTIGQHERSSASGKGAGQHYVEATESLRADLRVAGHAAARFYAEPERGWALLRLPLLPRIVLRAYSEGLPLSRLLSIARWAGRFTALQRP